MREEESWSAHEDDRTGGVGAGRRYGLGAGLTKGRRGGLDGEGDIEVKRRWLGDV